MNFAKGSFIACLTAVLFAVGGCAADAGDALEGSNAQGAQVDCSYVRCAMPLCAEGQHLATRGNRCCPECVGPESRCATVLCAAVECPEGQIRVRRGANDCCGHCQNAPAVESCRTDSDCPQIYCIACPCPVSQCQGRQCVTTTPDSSTCGTP